MLSFYQFKNFILSLKESVILLNLLLILKVDYRSIRNRDAASVDFLGGQPMRLKLEAVVAAVCFLFLAAIVLGWM